MGIKNKVVGLMAAAALTFSMAAGVAAQAETRPGTVELDGGACTAVITSGDLDFGTWTWDGIQYVSDGDQASELVVDVTTAWAGPNSQRPSCDVALSTPGLIRVDGQRGHAVTDLSAQNQRGSTPGPLVPIGNALDPAVFTLAAGSSPLGVQINSVGAEFAPGEYSGVFQVTIHDGQ